MNCGRVREVNDESKKRLAREIALLHVVDLTYGIPAAPVTKQLIAWSDQSLPDQLPPMPKWMKFKWGAITSLDFNDYWRQVDRQQWLQPRAGTNK